MRIGAIDQGTTSTRILVHDSTGKTHIAKAIGHRQILPKPGWVEHDPEELIRNIQACLDAAGPLDAVGIDNQGESCLAWDAITKEALSPVIVWQDERTNDVVARLKADGAQDLTLSRSGLPLDSYFSASKLGWILENEPKAQKAHRRGSLRLGTSDAFFVDRLAGRCITDVSTASRTALMNLETCDWDPDLCALFGVPIDTLPKIVSNTGDFGQIQGSETTAPLTALIVDQQAALYGAGCRLPGKGKVTFGTGAFALMLTGDTICREHSKGLLPTIAWRKQGQAVNYAVDGGVFAAGAAVNWARGLGLFNQFDEINAFDKPSAISRGLAFVPALAGLGCPHWNRRARGTWLGLGLDDGPKDLMQALLEGIAFRAAEVMRAMTETTAARSMFSIDGGLTANPYFCHVLVNAFQQSLRLQKNAEVTALGTACLAGEVIGMQNVPAQLNRQINPDRTQNHQNTFAKAIALAQEWGRE